MIVIEASNINFGGGLTLLEELIRKLEHQGIVSKVYVGYDVVYKKLTQQTNYRYVDIIKTDTLKTIYRFLKGGVNILYFCSLPPFVTSKNSMVYSHNPHFLTKPKLSIYNIKYSIYYYLVKLFGNNVDFFACQTQSVADKLITFGYKVELMPFYVKTTPKDLPKIYDFCYISTVAPHKNHIRLFDAVELVAKQGVDFNIAVTVANKESNSELLEKIKTINSSVGRNVIVNQGFVSRSEVEDILNSSNALLFPSLTETFGLPIAEAIECKLRVIASDRQFVHDLIENPIVFDPENRESIAKAIVCELNGNNANIKQQLLIQDKITELIEYLNK